MDLQKEYKEFLLNTVSWNTLRWVESMIEHFPRPKTKTSMGKTTNGWHGNSDGTITYSTG